MPFIPSKLVSVGVGVGFCAVGKNKKKEGWKNFLLGGEKKDSFKKVAICGCLLRFLNVCFFCAVACFGWVRSTKLFAVANFLNADGNFLNASANFLNAGANFLNADAYFLNAGANFLITGAYFLSADGKFIVKEVEFLFLSLKSVKNKGSFAF